MKELMKHLLIWYYVVYAFCLLGVCAVHFGLKQPLLEEVGAETLQVLKTVTYLGTLILAPLGLWLFARQTKDSIDPAVYRKAFWVKTALFVVPMVLNLVVFALLKDLSSLLMLGIVLVLWIMAKPKMPCDRTDDVMHKGDEAC